MPELPDLVYIEKKLRPAVLDQEIQEVAVWEPVVLRTGVLGYDSFFCPKCQPEVWILNQNAASGTRRHEPG